MAPPTARLEISYVSDDEVSISVETDDEGFKHEITEAKVFAGFAAGIIVALGNRPESLYLCNTLADLPDSGIDASSLGKWRIVRPSRAKHRKGFQGTLRISPGSARLSIKPKGFGLAGRHVGWYAPTAVLALFVELHGRQSDDGKPVLVETARRVGTIGAAGHITIRSQAEFADGAVWGALGELYGEAKADELMDLR